MRSLTYLFCPTSLLTQKFSLKKIQLKKCFLLFYSTEKWLKLLYCLCYILQEYSVRRLSSPGFYLIEIRISHWRSRKLGASTRSDDRAGSWRNGSHMWKRKRERFHKEHEVFDILTKCDFVSSYPTTHLHRYFLSHLTFSEVILHAERGRKRLYVSSS